MIKLANYIHPIEPNLEVRTCLRIMCINHQNIS